MSAEGLPAHAEDGTLIDDKIVIQPILICGGAASDTFAENRSRNSWAYSL
jgi:hypothetical protein